MTDTENAQKNWNFYLDDPIAGISHVILEEDTVFSPEEFMFRFQGYKTGYGLNATVWGKKVSLSLAIAPPGTPREALPADLGGTSGNGPEDSLPPEKRQVIERLQAKRDALRAKLPPPVDEAMEERYWNYVDSERFIGSFRQAAAIWNDPVMDRLSKCRQVGTPLSEMYRALHPIRLPDELVRDDTQFTVLLARIMQFSRAVEESAEKNGIALPPEVHRLTQLTDELTDRMIEGGNRLYGIPREMTQEEHAAFSDLKLAALYSDRPAVERLDMLETLWEHPLTDLDDKIDYLDSAIELIRQDALHCPDEAVVKRHLTSIGEYVGELEKEGEAAWQLRMAQAMMDTARAWREAAGMPPLSAGEWAPRLRLQSLTVETKERENGETDHSLTLLFQDDSRSFDGRLMRARLENGEVREIALAE